MIRIYAEQVSERLLFVLDFVFKDRGLEYAVTNDQRYFLACDGIRLNYSELELPGVLHVKPAGVLFDEDIRNYIIGKETFYGEECLSFDGVDDPLASIFYVLSRYEEYLDPVIDKHGRFNMNVSLQVKYGWLEKVICDRWAVSFLTFLFQKNGQEKQSFELPVKIVPTFDIDNAYAYLLKEGPRSWGAMLRDRIQGNKLRINERKQVSVGARKDPYDTYERIEAVSAAGFEVYVFWLLGDYRNYDRNVSYRDPRHQRLMRRMDQSCTVGIHPSYRSNSAPFFVKLEKERLEFVLDRKVLHSRQHFLKLSLPLTYQQLNAAGIEHDFTMGMADRVGFRAGTLRPFKWFDLKKNVLTQLTIHPFAYMDGTLNEYLQLSPDESKVKIRQLYDEVSKYGGDFCFIWHNETIGNYGKWQGWDEVLDFTLKLRDHE